MVRPKSIIQFERVLLAMVAMVLIGSAIFWDRTVAAFTAEGYGFTYIVARLVIGTGIYVLIWFFVARKASVVAKWALVVLAAVNLLSVALRVSVGRFILDLSGVLSIVALAMLLYSAWLLFRPDANAWFRGERPIDPAVFS